MPGNGSRQMDNTIILEVSKVTKVLHSYHSNILCVIYNRALYLNTCPPVCVRLWYDIL